MKRFALIILAIALVSESFGQDPQFTQFYANPLYLNPAFTGTTAQSRLVMDTRIQWPSIPGAFQTYSASYDQFVPMIKSGFGIDLYYDRAGSGGLSTTSATVMYAYELKIKRNLYETKVPQQLRRWILLPRIPTHGISTVRQNCWAIWRSHWTTMTRH